LVIALTATILSFVFIIPESKRKTLNPFFLFLHRVFNFKQLVIEKILQFVYVFATFLIIIFSLIIMFDSEFILGLVYLILGPVILRISFELFMMFILAVKNIIQINEKLNVIIDGKKDGNTQAAPVQNTQPQGPSNNQNVYGQSFTPPQTNNAPLFCIECGSVLSQNGSCPNPSCPKNLK
jgi:hypothetical protein